MENTGTNDNLEVPKERLYLRFFLVVPTLIVLYFVFRIFQPFLMPILLALILSTLCHPIYRRIVRAFRGRQNLASLATCLLITLVILIPILLLTLALAREVSQVYSLAQQRLTSSEFPQMLDIDSLPLLADIRDGLEEYVDLSQINIFAGVASALQEASVFLLRNSTAILGGFVQVISKFFLILLTMFFIFRDGPSMVRQLRSLTPISDRYEEQLVSKFRTITRATVLGTLITAIAQGIAGGLVFWLVGIKNTIFWGSLLGLCSMVPIVGTTIVWIPWAIYLFAAGSIGRGIALTLLCALFVGMIDNIIRPMFIEGQSGMHTLVVFFSLLGGVAYFGMVGLLLGPIVVALFLTFVEIYRTEFRLELLKPKS